MQEEPPERVAPPPDTEHLRALLAQCLELIAQDGIAAVEPFLRTHPAAAATLRERLQKLEAAGLLPDQAPTDRIPDRLGEFRLLRRLGSGGMGVVYLAVQEPLNREVALKLVRPEQLFFPGARERFRREVEAIARLNDPGIVPIYTVGEDQGIPYFAMEHVVGATLAQVVAAAAGRRALDLGGRDFAAAVSAAAGVPVPDPVGETFAGTWVQTAARIMQRVALATAHAHERGVLHRDLKPSNVMVTPAGRVLLLDFGLSTVSGTSRITKSGSQPGTLHYMAPEQLLDSGVGAPTDVYALGATLYELVALRAPFDAESSERLRQQILSGELKTLRRLEPGVHKDIDTICRCALDREPSRRYPSAEALSADLLRFLEHRPIQARPAGTLLRLRRWVGRHPGWATSVALFAAAVTGSALWRDSRSRAQQNLVQAVDALFASLSGPLDVRLTSVPGLDPLRQQQVEAALHGLGELLARNDDSEVVRRALAQGLLRAAYLRLELGQHEASERTASAAEAEFRRLQAEHPAEGRIAARLAEGMVCRGHSASRRGQTKLADQLWREARDVLQARVDGGDTDFEVVGCLGSCLTNLGVLCLEDYEYAAAERHLRAAIAVSEAANKRQPDRAHVSNLRNAHLNLGLLLQRRGETAGALAEYRWVLERLRTDHGREPADVDVRGSLAEVHTKVALLLRQQLDLPAALVEHDRAIEVQQQLCEQFPDRLAYRGTLDLMTMHAGVSRAVIGDSEESERLLRKAIAGHEALLERKVEYARIEPDLADMHARLAEVLEARGQSPDSERARLKAVAYGKPSWRADESLTGRIDQLNRRTELALLRARHPHHEEALAEHRAILAAVAELEPAKARCPDLHRQAALSHNGAARCLRELGRLPEAQQEHAVALACHERLAAAFPAYAALGRELATLQMHAGITAMYAEDLPTAERWLRGAIAALEALHREHPNLIANRFELARLCGYLAIVVEDLARGDEARPLIDRSLALLEELHTARPQHPALAAALAEARIHLGVHFATHGDLATARPALHRGIDAFEAVLTAGYRGDVRGLVDGLRHLAAVEAAPGGNADAAVAALRRRHELVPWQRDELLEFAAGLGLQRHAGVEALLATIR